jgi:hypothetical protein
MNKIKWREYFLEILNRDIKNEGEDEDDLGYQRELRINSTYITIYDLIQAYFNEYIPMNFSLREPPLLFPGLHVTICRYFLYFISHSLFLGPK